MSAPTSVRRFEVVEYVGSMGDVKNRILGADANLAGRGLEDLGWFEFEEAVAGHGYTRVDSEYLAGSDIRVQTWRPLTDVDDAFAAFAARRAGSRRPVARAGATSQVARRASYQRGECTCGWRGQIHSYRQVESRRIAEREVRGHQWAHAHAAGFWCGELGGWVEFDTEITTPVHDLAPAVAS